MTRFRKPDQAAVLVTAGRNLRSPGPDYRILLSLDDQNRPPERLLDLLHIQIRSIIIIIPADHGSQKLLPLRNLLRIRIHLFEISGDIKCRVQQNEPPYLVFPSGSGHRGYQPALASSQKNEILTVQFRQGADFLHDRQKIPLFRFYGHIFHPAAAF